MDGDEQPKHVAPSPASVANHRRCPNSKMASVGPNPPPPELCENDPNFAVICSFLDRFGEACGIDYPAIDDLGLMLQDTNDGAFVPTAVRSHVESA